ncbi:hypothetical protein KP509_02G087600 [Ceratopteris richardii]|nr:hypothetical protein KP509_02G087600 [Ceratopteris richardii]
MFLTTVFILAPLVFVWHTDHLEISSTTSMGTVILFVIIVTTIFFYKLISGTISMPKLFPTVHPDTSTVLSLFTVMPILVTTYTCHHMIHPILSQLGNESDSKRVITISIRFCAATYVITSAFAYILFGDDTLNDVMGNFNAELEVPYGTLFKDVIRLGFALHLILVFPLLKFSLHMNLDSLFDQSASPTTVDNSHFFLVTCSLLTAAFLGALSVPDVWTIFQCIGSTSAVCLCFVFPGSLVLRDQDGIYTVREKLIACFLIFLASSVSVMAVFGDIYNLFT